jgi:hypothetical protein
MGERQVLLDVVLLEDLDRAASRAFPVSASSVALHGTAQDRAQHRHGDDRPTA